jgi:hypothetical protein
MLASRVKPRGSAWVAAATAATRAAASAGSARPPPAAVRVCACPSLAADVCSARLRPAGPASRPRGSGLVAVGAASTGARDPAEGTLAGTGAPFGGVHAERPRASPPRSAAPTRAQTLRTHAETLFATRPPSSGSERFGERHQIDLGPLVAPNIRQRSHERIVTRAHIFGSQREAVGRHGNGSAGDDRGLR